MVVAPFGLLEMEVEGVSRQALALGQPDLGQAPEAFDAVDMDGSPGELVAGMIDTDVAIAELDQAVVAAPAIGVDDGARVDPAADNPLEGGLGAVRDDLGVDAALALKDAENDRLAVGAAPPPRRAPKKLSSTSTMPNRGRWASQASSRRSRTPR